MATNNISETSVPKNNNSNQSLFGKENYMLMLAGLLILGLGFFLMAGGKSSDPKVFDPKEVKILEKNSKPVSRKDIIEEQVNNLKQC